MQIHIFFHVVHDNDLGRVWSIRRFIFVDIFSKKGASSIIGGQVVWREKRTAVFLIW